MSDIILSGSDSDSVAPMTASEFNFWCAINGKPFRLVQRTWPDGITEWDIEAFPGRAEATLAYGTGQADEAVAAAAAFAFVAGLEWAEAGLRRGEDEDFDEDPLLEAPGGYYPEELAEDEEYGEAGEGDEAEEQYPAEDEDEEDAGEEDYLPPAEDDQGDEEEYGEDEGEDLPARPHVPPPLHLMQAAPPRAADRLDDESTLAGNARTLEGVLRNFRVRGEIMEVRQGPVVTLYEFEPVPGTKSSTVINLADDIARSMSTITTRIAVVPGRSVIGIELPNETRETVYLREILSSDAFQKTGGHLPLALGKDIGGEPVVADLARMPHLLIAGTTGSGKSVGINAMILSLLYHLPPEKCRLIMVDPKMLELSVYDGIPHLLTPVVTDPNKAVQALKWAVREMETRYRAMSLVGVRNIEGFNARVAELKAAGEKVTHRVQVGFDRSSREPIYEDRTLELERLPYIVIIVDEMADLMLVAGKEIEAAIQRLAQMARAAGIHLIMATQRPSVDVITGTIKANFPTRISFQVTSKIDSRTILGEAGAEQLVGQGDMLFMTGGGRITRVHGPFVSDSEVESIVNHLKSQGEPDYLHSVTEEEFEVPAAGPEGGGESSSEDDLYERAKLLVARERKVSVSFIQRYLQIGYNRSARLVERMESEGLISPANHAGKREILF
ncbi:DNA translocase FtsK [Telmatospirillum sp. J64-1]|uniref:DNA translocase FtsK n=1 Tax=Telmatospirillum sp. J64-1 TaxID=2502183 RepID=UPI00115CF4C2|nr:DNA translocase FtsK [Telmatospirillum sp. J64-1]